MSVISSLLVLLLAGSVAQSEPAEESDQMICVGHARIWNGSGDAVRTIATIPVPTDYRALYYQGGCGSGLVHDSLTWWHLNFGDESSMTAALAFFEADYLRVLPAPEAYANQLRLALRRARGDLRAAERFGAAEPRDWGGITQLVQRSSALRRLQALTEGHQRQIFLAEQYLLAADFYRSEPLYRQARRYLRTARSIANLVYDPGGLGADPDAAHLGFLDLDLSVAGRVREAEVRLAVLHAQFTRAPADIEAAGTLLESSYSPLLRQALESAYEQGPDFCDFNEDDARTEEVRAACRTEHDFPDRVVRFWRNQAELDLLKAGDPARYGPRPEPIRTTDPLPSAYSPRLEGPPDADQHSRRDWWYESIIRLLRRASEDGGMPGIYSARRIAHEIAMLELARAESHWRFAQQLRSEDAARFSQDIDDSEDAALRAVDRAAPLMPPYEAPRRFARIASSYLGYYRARLGRGTGELESRRIDRPEFARRAAYYEHMLRGLDRIAVGELPPR